MPTNGFLGSTAALLFIIVGLLSGVLSVIREVQLMYLPPKATERKVFWGFVRIAFVISAVMLLANEHSKVSELSKRLEEPKAAFGSVSIIPPTERAGYPDPETHQPNWAVLANVTTNKNLSNACVWLRDIVGPGGYHKNLKRRIGWFIPTSTTRAEGPFYCTDVPDVLQFVLFHCQVYEDGHQKLQLFFEPDPPEYAPMKDMAKGEYKITLSLEASNIQPIVKTFRVTWSGDMRNFHLEETN